MDKLDWRDLHYFNAVARHGSLASAAQHLGVTHSTVFRRLQHLEQSLGVRLFDRLPEGYRLTSLGEDLVPYTETVATTIDDMQRMLANRSDDLTGSINVTAPHNFAYRYLPPLIAEFHQRHPGISVNLMASNADFNLSRREADLAIRATTAPPEYLLGRKLFSLRWAAYAAADYDAQPPSTLEELHQHSVIASDQSLMHVPVFKWLATAIPNVSVAARCNDLMSMSSLAESGQGIAFLPDDQFKPTLKRLFALDDQFNSDIWLLTHPDQRGCARLSVFKDFLAERLCAHPVFQEWALFGGAAPA